MQDKLDLLIIFPNNRLHAYGSLGDEISAITPPVQDGLTAAYVRERGFHVGLLDADARGLLPDQAAREVLHMQPRLVLVSTDQVNSGDVTKMAAAGETTRAIKRWAPSSPVLLEGVVPSAYPERMLTEEGADYVCQGEPYNPVVNLLSALRDHGEHYRLGESEIVGIWGKVGDRIIRSTFSPRFIEIDRLPMTAWDLMPPSQYRAHHWHCFDRLGTRTPYAGLFTNMGCPHACTFCSVNVVAGGPNFRPRSPDHILRELDVLVQRYHVRNIRILDNVFTQRMDMVEELCDQMIARHYDLNLWAYARVESIRSLAMLHKMKKAGVNWLAFGFEAAHDRVRKAASKSVGQPVIEQAIEWTRQAGIHIVGNFIFGLPEDDRESMQMSFDMARRYNFEWANFYCAMAYPGTRLYDEALRQGQALPKDWSAYGQYSPNAHPLATEHLSSKEVLAFRDQAFKEYYSHERYLHMIGMTFGSEAVALVKRILSVEIKRDAHNTGGEDIA